MLRAPCARLFADPSDVLGLVARLESFVEYVLGLKACELTYAIEGADPVTLVAREIFVIIVSATILCDRPISASPLLIHSDGITDLGWLYFR